jgi:predicted small secreted protein
MRNRIVRLMICAPMAIAIPFVLSGCHTWKGVGEDVSGVGDSIEGKKSDDDSDDSDADG